MSRGTVFFKSRTNRLPACQQQGKRFISIRSNQLQSTTFSTHPQSPHQLYFLGLAQVGCIGQPLSRHVIDTTFKCIMLHVYFRIAQRRDASVTKEVSMELDSNKKLTRQEKDERLK